MHSNKPDYVTDKITLFLSGEHPCSYLPGKFSQEIYAQPITRFDNQMYSQLIYSGFRRSGELVYRPHCKFCSSCVPVRIPGDSFKARRIHKRILKRNADISTRLSKSSYDQEHFDLYSRYVNERHPDGGMDNPEPREYIEMLTCQWTDTRFMEFFLENKLVAVAVMDVLSDGFSAVYTFFDPELTRTRSLGTLAVLKQMELIGQESGKYLYLGYMIENCKKMNYKKEFGPMEQYLNNNWEIIPGD